MFVFSPVLLPLVLPNLIAINSKKGRDFNYMYACSLSVSFKLMFCPQEKEHETTGKVSSKRNIFHSRKKPNSKLQKQEISSETKATKMSFEKLKFVYIYNTSTFYSIFIIINIKYHWDKAEVETKFRNTA